MKKMYLSASLLTAIFLVSINTACAQQLATSWTANIHGEFENSR